MPKTAVFPGSFNPFTIGHKSIVERGLNIFDHIIIAIGHNGNKPMGDDLVKKIETIRKVFEGNDAVEVTAYHGLTAEYARSIGASAILRGVRNITDFEYERNLADVNKNVLGIETVFLFSLPEYSCISSSMVRELASFGQDVSSLVP